MAAHLSSAAKGARGEAAAASFLESAGWSVLARNFRCPVGEIDLVARRDDVVAFFEVKAWRTMPVEELERSVGHRKRRRIARAARIFLAQRPNLEGAHLRFDVVFLGGQEGIQHIPGAFSEEGID